MQTIRLSNGVLVPMLGYGTWQIRKEDAYHAVKKALEVGYRHIDTAWIYRNETFIGQALKESGLPREDLFITSKRWNDFQGYAPTIKAFDESLANLGLEYLDLYLLHWPKAHDQESYRALEDLYRAGKIRAIGVSNYHVHHLEALNKGISIFPMVNQIEFHPYLTQTALRTYAKTHDLTLEAYSPLLHGDFMRLPLLSDLSQKYRKTPAQILLRFNLDLNHIVLPKAQSEERMRENFEIFDFKLEAGDVEALLALNRNERVGADPDNFDF
jgi:diketogulonate reductase-like aldo/keto reductase